LEECIETVRFVFSRRQIEDWKTGVEIKVFNSDITENGKLKRCVREEDVVYLQTALFEFIQKHFSVVKIERRF
jgi:hypothetical protein